MNYSTAIPYDLLDSYSPDAFSQKIGLSNIMKQSGYNRAVEAGLLTAEQAYNDYILKGKFDGNKFMRDHYKNQYNSAYKNNDTKGMSEALNGLKEIDSKISSKSGAKSSLGNFEKGLGIANTVAGGLAAATNIGLGIYGAYQAGEQLKLAKEKFEIEKGLINRNLENQGKLINEQVASRANLAGIYGAKNSGGYSYAKGNYYNNNKVDTTPVG